MIMDYFLMTIADAVKYLKSCCKDRNGLIPKTFGNYYCGITNDIDRREGEHNATYLGYVKAQSFDAAKRLEAQMHAEGFDTGKQLGNGQEDSIYVYVYKKIPGVTNESLE